MILAATRMTPWCFDTAALQGFPTLAGMNLKYCPIEGGNFGDTLNTMVWRTLFPHLSALRPDVLVYGIGTLLDTYRARLQSEDLIAALLLAALFGVLVFAVFTVVQKITVGRWHTSAH